MRFLNIITDKDDKNSIAGKVCSSMAQDPARGDFFTEVEEVPRKTNYYDRDARVQLFSLPIRGPFLFLGLPCLTFPSFQ